jgi:hypothetical protein
MVSSKRDLIKVIAQTIEFLIIVVYNVNRYRLTLLAEAVTV